MTFETHALIEALFVVPLLFCASALRGMRQRGVAVLWSACVATMILGIVHGYVPLWVETLIKEECGGQHADRMVTWIPMTWALTSVWLAIGFAVSVLVGHEKDEHAVNPDVMGFPMLIIVLLPYGVWMTGLDHPWVLFGDLRWVDLTLATAYVAAAVGSGIGRLIIPGPALLLALSHFAMTFSSGIYDALFVAGHLLRLVGLVWWSRWLVFKARVA